jgi:predicted MPP superfamily phosphohydrolase
VNGWLAGVTALASGAGAYALYEPFRFRIVTHRLAVRSTTPPLRILHISDWHLSVRQRRKAEWLRGLADRLGEVPDLVCATGDMIEDDRAIEHVVRLMAGIEARYGRFYVLGSHDYYQARFHNYAKYWTGNRNIVAPKAATEILEEGLRAKGWISLTNRTEIVETPHGLIRLAGVDDPYLKRHTTAHIGRGSNDALALGLMHAPDLVSEFALAGYDLVLAGHTHAGQVRVPLKGALVTNCNLPTALAGGAHRVGETWLHVSPGLGTGKFSPIRFNARPEVTTLELIPARS